MNVHKQGYTNLLIMFVCHYISFIQNCSVPVMGGSHTITDQEGDADIEGSAALEPYSCLV